MEEGDIYMYPSKQKLEDLQVYIALAGGLRQVVVNIVRCHGKTIIIMYLRIKIL